MNIVPSSTINSIHSKYIKMFSDGGIYTGIRTKGRFPRCRPRLRLLGFRGSFSGLPMFSVGLAEDGRILMGFVRIIMLDGVALGRSRETLPTAFVLPSRNTMRMPTRRYSGFLMKRKWTRALSPVRRQSMLMLRMEAVWRMLPQWTGKKTRE